MNPNLCASKHPARRAVKPISLCSRNVELRFHLLIVIFRRMQDAPATAVGGSADSTFFSSNRISTTVSYLL